METLQIPEERKQEIYTEEEDAIQKEFELGDNCWFSCVRSRLFIIVTAIELARMDKVLSDEVAFSYQNKLTEITKLVEENEKNGIKEGELPSIESRKAVIDKIVELQYELEQLITF